MKKIIVLGVSGMLGHKLFEVLSTYSNYNVYGTVSNQTYFKGLLPKTLKPYVINGIKAEENDSIQKLIKREKPNVIINCIGIIKQKSHGQDPYSCILLNSLFPHQLAHLCRSEGIRFITIGTDCVFNGKKKKPYTEKDKPDCEDIYGKTKFLGEVTYPGCLTLRTSIIGHELWSQRSLIDWFLNSKKQILYGYSNALYSGFPTIEFAEIIAKYIIPHDSLEGLYQVSSDQISKFDLLNLVAKIYKKQVTVVSDGSIKINRVLDSKRFKKLTGYTPPNWPLLVQKMYNDFLKSPFYANRAY